MSITIHNKLVRDRIPELIEADGNVPHTRILSDQEYISELIAKIHEEVDEYNNTTEIEELADILEVFMALIQGVGINWADLDLIRHNKKINNGGFESKLFLSTVERKD